MAAGALIALVAIFFSPRTGYSDDAGTQERGQTSYTAEIEGAPGVFMVGEELDYNVSYAFFDLGHVRIVVLDTISKQGRTLYTMKAFVDSYNGVPFVDLHEVFYSEVSAEPYAYFYANHNTADPATMPYTEYSFDYGKNMVRYEIGTMPGKKKEKEGTVPITRGQQDGLSLFFYARCHCKDKKKIAVPTFVSEQSFFTQFNFMNKRGSQEIDAVPYPIETVEFDGTADFTGIFGLTGYFQGFFSNDNASIPITAKMKVILGSINIELIKWNRPGWVPPRAVE
jgi:hypothetical protein